MRLADNQFIVFDSAKNFSFLLKIILGFAAYAVLYCVLFGISVGHPEPFQNAVAQHFFSFIFAIPAYVGALFVLVFFGFMIWQPSYIMEITPDEIKIVNRKGVGTSILKQQVEWIELREQRFANSAGYMVRVESPGQRFYYLIDKVTNVVPMQQKFGEMGYVMKKNV